MRRRLPSPRTILRLSLLAMLLCALLPRQWVGWTGWFRGPLMTVVAPISAPLAALAAWLRPGERRRIEEDMDAEALRAERDFYKSEYLAAEQRIDELRRVVRALQDDIPYGPAVRLRRLEASRIGDDLGAGAFMVSRGSVHGVTLNTVAVAIGAPHQIVGVVSSVGPTVSAVHVITDRRLSPGLIGAMVMPAGLSPADAAAQAPRCQFRPVGDGTLAGEMGADDAARLQRGDGAFLDDPHWPSAAQRLLIGRVARVEEIERPLFRRVVIAPDFDLTRVRGVVLRVPAEDEGGAIPPGGAR